MLKLKPPSRNPYDISTIKEQFIPKINLSPMYQRQDVWDKDKREKLIQSIARNVPINSITLNQEGIDDRDRVYTVIDGKQRLTSIRNYLGMGTSDDTFSVNFEFSNGNQKLTFERLKILAKEDTEVGKEAKEYLEKIYDFKIDIVKYNNLSLPEQAEVFKIINYSAPLSKEEQSFGEFYNIKNIIEYLKEKLNPALNISSSLKDKRNKTGKLDAEIFRLFFCFFSSNNLEDFGPKFSRVCESKLDGVRQFASKIHNSVISYLNQNKTANYYSKNKEERIEETEKYLKHIKIYKEISEYISIINQLVIGNVITPINEASKKSTSQWIITHFSLFILEKYKSNIITKAMLSDQADCFKNLFKKYKNEYLLKDYSKTNKNAFYDKVRQMFNKETYEAHSNELERFFKELFEDVGVKNKKINDLDKKNAYDRFKSSGCICPICKKETSDDQITYDHLNPKSLFSDIGSVVVLCDSCNRKKSNHTIKTTQMQLDFLIGESNKKID